MDNIQIVQQLYRYYGEKNFPGLMSLLDKDLVWERPGSPDIPFAGIFKGMEGLGKMFSIIEQSIKIKSFNIQKFLGNDDIVVVIGNDTADVIATGKSYTSEWVYVFTLKDQKITYIKVYIDTLEIAKAFQP